MKLTDMEVLTLLSKVRKKDAVSTMRDRRWPAGRGSDEKWYQIPLKIKVTCGYLSVLRFSSTFRRAEGGNVEVKFSKGGT